jgi:hypothetical protein
MGDPSIAEGTWSRFPSCFEEKSVLFLPAKRKGYPEVTMNYVMGAS